jgi:hypothetical protein
MSMIGTKVMFLAEELGGAELEGVIMDRFDHCDKKPHPGVHYLISTRLAGALGQRVFTVWHKHIVSVVEDKSSILGSKAEG